MDNVPLQKQELITNPTVIMSLAAVLVVGLFAKAGFFTEMAKPSSRELSLDSFPKTLSLSSQLSGITTGNMQTNRTGVAFLKVLGSDGKPLYILPESEAGKLGLTQ